jgi:O-antigen/teichoic acid export membrane protein
MARGSGTVFALRLAGAGLALAFNILLARRLGAYGAGAYYIGLGVSTIASLVSRLGMGNAVLRYVAADADRGAWHAVAGTWRTAVSLVFASSVVAAAAVAVAAGPLASLVFDDPGLESTIRIMAFAIIPFGLVNLMAEALKAIGEAGRATLLQGLFIPAGMLAAVTVLGPTGRLDMGTVALAYVVVTTAILAIGYGIWRRQTPELRGCSGKWEPQRLLRTSLPMLLVALMSTITNPLSTVLIGVWLPVESVGVYGVAQRCASLMVLVFSAVNSVTAPRFAALHQQKRMRELGMVLRRASFLAAALATPFLGAYLGFPTQVLRVFGDEFTAASGALSILAVGQFIAASAGPYSSVLMMSGRERTMRNIVATSTAAYVLAAVTLIPTAGIGGAALARAVTVAATNIAALGMVFRTMGLSPVPRAGHPGGSGA